MPDWIGAESALAEDRADRQVHIQRLAGRPGSRVGRFVELRADGRDRASMPGPLDRREMDVALGIDVVHDADELRGLAGPAIHSREMREALKRASHALAMPDSLRQPQAIGEILPRALVLSLRKRHPAEVGSRIHDI